MNKTLFCLLFWYLCCIGSLFSQNIINVLGKETVYPKTFFCITYSINQCGSCHLPLSVLVEHLHKIYPTIPILVVVSDSLTISGKQVFYAQNKLDSNIVQLVDNSTFYLYLVSKTKNEDNVSFISEGKIMVIQKQSAPIDAFIQKVKKIIVSPCACIKQKTKLSHTIFPNITMHYRGFFRI